jgi:hypothetical protein
VRPFEIERPLFELESCRFKTPAVSRRTSSASSRPLRSRGAHEVCLFDLEVSQFDEEEQRFEFDGWRFVDASPQFELDLPQNQDGTRLDEDVWCPFALEWPPHELELCLFEERERLFALESPRLEIVQRPFEKQLRPFEIVVH